MFLKFVDLVFLGGTVDIISMPKLSLGGCWRFRNG